MPQKDEVTLQNNLNRLFNTISPPGGLLVDNHNQHINQTNTLSNPPNSSNLRLDMKPINKTSSNFSDNKQNTTLIKLLIIGDSGVGKMEFLSCFIEDRPFNPSCVATIGIDSKTKLIKLDNKEIQLKIWDTVGQERFRTITPAYYRGCHGIFIMYDITDKQSFWNVFNWKRNVEQHAPENIPIHIVGSRCHLDSKRMVATEEGQKCADSFSIKFFECSAEKNINIQNSFESLAREAIQQQLLTKKEITKEPEKSSCLIM